MEENVESKRMSLEKIIEFANKIQERYDYFSAFYAKHDEQTKEKFLQENGFCVSYSELEFSISYNTNERFTRKNDLRWFVDLIEKNARKISSVQVSYMMTFRKSDEINDFGTESFRLTLYEDSIFKYFDETELYDIDEKIGHTKFKKWCLDFLDNLPSRLDKTISSKYFRCNIPSLAIGWAIGIVATIILSVLNFLGINFYINDFVANVNIFVPAMLGIFFAIGLVIPGPNHALYKKMQIKQKYVGFNRSTHSDIYEDDLNDVKKYCEVEFGKFANLGRVRAKINRNFKISKWAVIVEVLLFAIIYVTLIFI